MSRDAASGSGSGHPVAGADGLGPLYDPGKSVRDVNQDVGRASFCAAINHEIPMTKKANRHEHDGQRMPSDPTLRVMALESPLVEKGLVDPEALDALDCWLVALHSLLLGKGAIGQAELRDRRQAWEEACRRTPHGATVTLAAG
jgi:hypothetical protein